MEEYAAEEAPAIEVETPTNNQTVEVVKDVGHRAVEELKGIFDSSPLCGIFVVLIFLALLSFIFRGGGNGNNNSNNNSSSK